VFLNKTDIPVYRQFIQPNLAVNVTNPFPYSTFLQFQSVRAVRLSFLSDPFSTTYVVNLNILHSLPNFFPYLKTDTEVNREERLYYMIQAELYSTRTNWCDLFVWTPSQTLLLRVERNERFIQANVPLVDWVFENYIYSLCRKCDRKKFPCRELQKRDWTYREEVYPKK
jgi:hypothetical protein